MALWRVLDIYKRGATRRDQAPAVKRERLGKKSRQSRARLGASSLNRLRTAPIVVAPVAFWRAFFLLLPSLSARFSGRLSLWIWTAFVSPSLFLYQDRENIFTICHPVDLFAFCFMVEWLRQEILKRQGGGKRKKKTGVSYGMYMFTAHLR